MRNTSKVRFLGFMLTVFVFVCDSPISFAAEDSKVSEFLHRYDVLKTHTTTLLESSRQARVQGQVMSDRKPLLYLRKDVMDFCFDLRKYLHVEKTRGASKPVALDTRGNILALAYSCEAMEQVLEAEFDAYQGERQNPDLLHIQQKYEEVWKIADQVVTGEARSIEQR